MRQSIENTSPSAFLSIAAEVVSLTKDALSPSGQWLEAAASSVSTVIPFKRVQPRFSIAVREKPVRGRLAVPVTYDDQKATLSRRCMLVVGKKNRGRTAQRLDFHTYNTGVCLKTATDDAQAFVRVFQGHQRGRFEKNPHRDSHGQCNSSTLMNIAT